jgi:hypothetical protein
MSVSIFEVKPSDNLEERFIYTLESSDGNVLPFSATTLRLVDVPPNASFDPIKGGLAIKDGLSITLKKGYPYIAITPSGPAIAWWIDGKFNIPDQVKDRFPLQIPKKLLVEPGSTTVESVKIRYPEADVRATMPEVSLKQPVATPPPQPVISSSVPTVSSPPFVQPAAPVSHSFSIPPVQQPAIVPPAQSLSVEKTLESIGSPATNYTAMDLTDRLVFLEKLVETFLRREYKIYAGISCPDRFTVGSQSVPLTPFADIQTLMAKGEISRFELNPMFQPFAGSQRTLNRFLTFYDKKGTPYVTKASYDVATNNLGPPAD